MKKRVISILLAMALLVSLEACGARNSISSVSEIAESTESTENAEADSAFDDSSFPETLFDQPVSDVDGLYSVDTSFLVQDDYIVWSAMLDGRLLLYTEDYGQGQGNSLWLMNPYTGKLLKTIAFGEEQITVDVSGDVLCLAKKGEAAVTFYDAQLNENDTFSIPGAEIRSVQMDESGSLAYIVDNGLKRVWKLNMQNGSYEAILSSADSFIDYDTVFAGKTGDLLLLKSMEESMLFDLSTGSRIETGDVVYKQLGGKETFTALAKVENQNYTAFLTSANDAADPELIVPHRSGENWLVCPSENSENVYTFSDTMSLDMSKSMVYCHVYDCASGCETGELTFPVEMSESGGLFSVDGCCCDEDRDILFFYGFCDGYRVYAWDISSADSCGIYTTISASRELEQTDESLDDLREQAAEIGEKYGIRICIGDDNMENAVCQYTPIYDPAMIAMALNELDRQFSRYPSSCFSRVSEITENTITVHLTGSLGLNENNESSPSSIAGLCSGCWIYLDITACQLNQNINHEFMHTLSWCASLVMEDWAERWLETLPEDFYYSFDYRTTVSGVSIADTDSPEKAYFIDSYGTMNADEDQARLFEYAMLEAEDHSVSLEDYSNILPRLQVLCNMLREVYDTDGSWPETTEWETAL